MVPQVFTNLGWAIAFMFIGAMMGSSLIIVFTSYIPRIVNKLTPNIDEEKEILRGNTAVAEYFGRIVAAAIIGISLVVSAAILGGILAGLHG
jgi:hypothetical protein